MMILWFILFIFLNIPLIGELVIYHYNLNHYIMNMSISPQLLLNHLFFNFLFIIVSYLFYRKLRLNIRPVNDKRFETKHFQIAYKTILFLIIIILIFIFLFIGRLFLFEHIDRGKIRTSLGILGPIYTWIIIYLLPALIFYISLLYKKLKRTTIKIKLELLSTYILAVLIGLITGYKADFLWIILMGIIIFYIDRFLLRNFFFIFSILIILLVFATTLVRGGIPLKQAFNFLIYRTFYLSTAGTVAAWNIFPSGVTLDNYAYMIIGLLGSKISSLLLDSKLSAINTNLSVLISYKAYPNVSKVLSGEVNLTLTIFGEAILIWSKYFHFVHAVLYGSFVGIVIAYFYNNILKGNLLKSSLSSIVVLQIIISTITGNSLAFLSLYFIIYLTLTYITLSFIDKKVKRKLKLYKFLTAS